MYLTVWNVLGVAAILYAYNFGMRLFNDDRRIEAAGAVATGLGGILMLNSMMPKTGLFLMAAGLAVTFGKKFIKPRGE